VALGTVAWRHQDGEVPADPGLLPNAVMALREHRKWQTESRGVLERMLVTALRCCGSRELQISDSGV
jgi:hypothetical protein